MARRLKSLMPGSAVDGHGGGLGSLGQADDQSVQRDLPAHDAGQPGEGGDGNGTGDRNGAGSGHGAGEVPEAAPTALLDRPVKERRRRWITGQLRDVPAANPLCDISLLVRVRDRLKELPDQRLPRPEPEPTSGADRSTGSAGGSGEGDQGILAIRDTFAIVGAAGDMAAAYFYGWLFANHPELRELFPPAMDEQRDRLFGALTHIVESLRTPEEMAVYLAQLGRDHRKYAVRPEMYTAVGAALIATLRAFAGSAFTSAAEDAWVATYGVASDIMIKAADDAGANTPAFWHAEVIEHERRGHDIAIITVAPDERFNYRAGQHVTVQTSRWPRVWRPYSIACRQREDGLLRFHVKAVSGGWVSNTLVARTSVGDPLILGPAVGSMTLASAERRDLLCVAGGTGLAPVKAIAEQVVYEESTQRNHRNIWLFWGTRTEKDMYDLRDLWRLTDIYPWLQVHPVASDDPAYPGMQGNVGRVAARYLPHGDCEAYIAGPAAMVQETIKMLTKTGMPADRVHYDDGLIAGRKRVGTGT